MFKVIVPTVRFLSICRPLAQHSHYTCALSRRRSKYSTLVQNSRNFVAIAKLRISLDLPQVSHEFLWLFLESSPSVHRMSKNVVRPDAKTIRKQAIRWRIQDENFASELQVSTKLRKYYGLLCTSFFKVTYRTLSLKILHVLSPFV